MPASNKTIMAGMSNRKMNLKDRRTFIPRLSSKCEPSANRDWDTAIGMAKSKPATVAHG